MLSLLLIIDISVKKISYKKRGFKELFHEIDDEELLLVNSNCQFLAVFPYP